MELMKHIEKKAKEYREKLGDNLKRELMKEVLWGAMDEDTLDLVEAKYDEEESTYEQIKAWLVDMNERNVARRNNTTKKGKNDMDVGVLNENEDEECSECNKSEGKEDDEENKGLSAFGKGGKGGGKGPMTCFTCNGTGHPARLCPTTDAAASMECHNCKGKGHYKSQCTSEGGGQYTPYVPKGKGKDGKGGQGKGYEKGYGKGGYGKGGYGKGGYGKGGYGKGGYGKGGKGKGQILEMDWHEPQPWMTDQDSWNGAAGMYSFGYENRYENDGQWELPRALSSLAPKPKNPKYVIKIKNKFEELKQKHDDDDDDEDDDE